MPIANMDLSLDDILGGAATIGGGALSVVGAPEVGIPLMAGGLGMIGQGQANSTNEQIASNATSANTASAAAANALSEQELGQQEQYETQMSNTAYQRSVADMKAAGLNPILAGMNQSPASTPSVQAAAPKQATAATTTVDSTLGAGLASAQQAQQIQTGITTAGLNDALATKALQDTDTSAASAKQMSIDTTAKQSQLDAIAARAKAEKAKATTDYKANTYDAIMSRANRDSGTAKNLMQMFNPFGDSLKQMNKPGYGTLKDGTNFNLDTGEIP